jgi:hypothetical protein
MTKNDGSQRGYIRKSSLNKSSWKYYKTSLKYYKTSLKYYKTAQNITNITKFKKWFVTNVTNITFWKSGFVILKSL